MKRRIFLSSGLAITALGLAACDSSETNATPQFQFQKPSTAAGRLDLAAQLEGFKLGTGSGAQAFVMFDPQCPHCAFLWASMKPLRERISAVWAPVALLGKASGPQGAMILAAEDPERAMNEHEASLAQRRGGISVPLAGAPKESLVSVEKNTRIFEAIGAQSVPFMVFRKANGDIATNAGAMPTANLAQLLGV